MIQIQYQNQIDEIKIIAVHTARLHRNKYQSKLIKFSVLYLPLFIVVFWILMMDQTSIIMPMVIGFMVGTSFSIATYIIRAGSTIEKQWLSEPSSTETKMVNISDFGVYVESKFVRAYFMWERFTGYTEIDSHILFHIGAYPTIAIPKRCFLSVKQTEEVTTLIAMYLKKIN